MINLFPQGVSKNLSHPIQFLSKVLKWASQLEYENHLDEEKKKWFAIYTQYKREKVVVKALERKGVECYLPLNRVVRRWERKVKEVELPLINCYVFVNIVKSDYIKVLETENVLNFVRFSKNLISIPDEEIVILKRVTGEIGDIELYKEQVVKGDRVEIIGGELTGVKGKLIEVSSSKNFVVNLGNLGYSLRMEINPSLLRKI